MSSTPTPKADAQRAMREAAWQREQDRQAAERKQARSRSNSQEPGTTDLKIGKKKPKK